MSKPPALLIAIPTYNRPHVLEPLVRQLAPIVDEFNHNAGSVAAGFPTTVAPIIQNGAGAVFIDNHPVTGNVRVDQLEEAYREGKTKAVMLAHALGNPLRPQRGAGLLPPA